MYVRSMFLSLTVIPESKQSFPKDLGGLWQQLATNGPILCQRNRARALNPPIFSVTVLFFSERILDKKLDVYADRLLSLEYHIGIS